VCQNPSCQWVCSVDCPEVLHLKLEPIAPTPITVRTAAQRPAARKSLRVVKGCLETGIPAGRRVR
jgi:hypothetical protein